MLATIWPEIVKKRYNKLCDNIQNWFSDYYIPTHAEEEFSLFLNKKLLDFDISSLFLYKFTVVYVYWPIAW